MNRIILLLFCITVFASCKKKEETPVTDCSNNGWEYIAIDSSMYDYYFKAGSYWVYTNDTTKEMDSLYLSRVQTGCEPCFIPPASYNQGKNYEYYIMNYLKTVKNESGRHESWLYDCIQGSSLMRDHHPGSYDWYVGWLLNAGTPMDSLKVGANTFYNIYLSSDKNSPRTYSYTAKGTGVVKLVANGHELNLVRWKIIK